MEMILIILVLLKTLIKLKKTSFTGQNHEPIWIFQNRFLSVYDLNGSFVPNFIAIRSVFYEIS